MDFFVWNDQFSTQVETIDKQHKVLMVIINDLYGVLHAKAAEAAVNKVISELEDYTKYHFAEEEKVLEKKNSPDLALQRRQHIFFTGEIAKIKKAFLDGKSTSPQSLLSFLKDWLTEHILTLDKKIGGLGESKS